MGGFKKQKMRKHTEKAKETFPCEFAEIHYGQLHEFCP